MENELIFDQSNPEKYPYGFTKIRHKVRIGMYYDEYIPNIPLLGEWIIDRPLPDSKIIKIRRVN